jgi:hypothetical protein
MPLIVSKEKLLNIYKAELLYELHCASECIRLFEAKYGNTFEEFKKRVSIVLRRFRSLG